jgi:hypothetical protein
MSQVVHKDKPATTPQIIWIMDLMKQRQISDEQQAWLDERLGTTEEDTRLNRDQASRIIDAMKLLPKVQVIKADQWPLVPAGRYAVKNQEGILQFYHVDRPSAGKWSGYTFLSVRASDERHPIRAIESKKFILDAIAKDPKAASLRFGREIGECGICGRTLTDEQSRARGIGPICAAKQEW